MSGLGLDGTGRNLGPPRPNARQAPARRRHVRRPGNRKFHRVRPNELWVTDITEHPTREGKVYCAAVLDAFSRRIVGWSIDSRQDTDLVINALDLAIRNRHPEPGGIVHADHGVQFTSWAFGNKIRSAGLMPSFGSVGDGLDNVMMKSFWSSMQIELLNRKKWKTRIELSNAIFEYIEIFSNRQRRHSSLGYRTQSNTSYSPRRTPSQPEAHHRKWKPGWGQVKVSSKAGAVPCQSTASTRRTRTMSTLTRGPNLHLGVRDARQVDAVRDRGTRHLRRRGGRGPQ